MDATEETIFNLFNAVRTEDTVNALVSAAALLNLHFQQQERIACALERLASTVYTSEGYNEIATRKL